MTTRECTECAGEFAVGSQGRPRMTCTPACREARAARLRAERAKSYGECEISDCTKRKRSAGAEWCEMHYGRNRTMGGPLAVPKRRQANGTCHHCGGPAPRQRLFCDRICQRRNRHGAPGRTSTCATCEGPIPEGSHLNASYCSYECERDVRLSKVYSVSVERLRAERLEQGGCAICLRDVELVVDHDHDTGEYRGLLCNQCNVGLGMFMDSPGLLASASRYLEERNGLGD